MPVISDIAPVTLSRARSGATPTSPAASTNPVRSKRDSAHAIARPPQPATTLSLPTPHGPARGLWRPSSQRHAAVILLPDADNALSGPQGFYGEIAPALQRAAAVAQLAYPHPGDLPGCCDVILAALDALNSRSVERVALIGWGFGSMVAALVAARSPLVSGLACLAPELASTASAESDTDVARIHAQLQDSLDALGARRLLLIPASLAGCEDGRDALLQRLTRWTAETLRSPFRPARPRHSAAPVARRVPVLGAESVSLAIPPAVE